MKNLNRLLSSAIIISIVITSFSACVTSKKYKAAESRIQKLQQDSVNCQANIRKLSAEKLGIQAEFDVTEQSLTQQLIIKQEELNEKAKQLNDREQRLKEFQSITARQNQSIINLRNSISRAMIDFKPEELTVNLVDGKLYVSLQEMLLFKTGSAKVDPKGKEALGKLAEVLNSNPDIQIIIEGHTDTVPISKVYNDNWDLSVNRAISIARILQKDYKVDPKRLIASGRSEYFPVATNSTPEGRSSNRRTEIILMPKLDELMKIINK